MNLNIRAFIILIGLIQPWNIYADKPVCKPYAHVSICRDCFSEIDNTSNLSDEEKVKKFETCKSNCQKDHEYEYYMADYLMHARQEAKAEKLLQASITQYKDDTKKLKHMLMLLYLCYGRYDDLLSMSNSIIKQYPDWFSGYYYKGTYYIGKYDTAEFLDKGYALLTKSIQLQDNVEAHVMLAGYYYKKEEFENVLLEYKKAYDMDRVITMSSMGVGIMAAQSAMNLNKPSTAEWILKVLKVANSTSISSRDEYKQAWNRLNELKEGMRPVTLMVIKK